MLTACLNSTSRKIKINSYGVPWIGNKTAVLKSFRNYGEKKAFNDRCNVFYSCFAKTTESNRSAWPRPQNWFAVLLASPQMEHMWKPNFRMTRATVSPRFIHKIVLLCFIRSVVHISTFDLCAMLNCMCKIVKPSCNLREMYVCGVQKNAF